MYIENIVMITIKHLEMQQMSASNDPQGIDKPLRNKRQPKSYCFSTVLANFRQFR